MESDHPEPVVHNWIAGFFIAVLTVTIPVFSVTSERVKSNQRELTPSEKRTLPALDASRNLSISNPVVLHSNN